MAENDQQARTTTASEILGRSQGSTKKSGLGSAVAALQGSLGNDELLGRLAAGNTNRDDLLEFLIQRLAEMRTAQLAELDLAKATTNAVTSNLSESESQNEKPDPTRWIPAAKLYQDAAKALCSGNLTRGADLIDQAVKEDRRAFENLSKFAESEAAAEFEDPARSSGEAPSDVVCAGRAEPDGVEVADEIQRVTQDKNHNLKGTRRELDPWWTELDEEEEEEEGAS